MHPEMEQFPDCNERQVKAKCAENGHARGYREEPMKDADASLSGQRGVDEEYQPSGSNANKGQFGRGFRGFLALAILVGTSLAGYALIFTVLRNITS